MTRSNTPPAIWHIDLGGDTMSDDKTTVTEKETVTEPADEPDTTTITVETPKGDEDEDEG